MNYSKFRNADLIIMGILMILATLIPLYLFSKASFEFYISFTMLIAYITMIRWGYLGIIPFIFNQIVLTVVQISFFDMEILLSTMSNLVPIIALLPLPFILKKTKDLKEHILILWSYLALLYVLFGATQALVVSIIQNSKFIPNLLFYLFNREFFSFIISCILLALLRRYDNLLVDVKQYLIKIQEVEEEDEWKGLEEDPQ